MISSPKDWSSLLGFDRDTDEKTMASRARVLCKTLAYLQEHFSDPESERPSEDTVIEVGQFLILAEGMESKGRSIKFKELYEIIAQLHLHWDEIDRTEAFRAIGKKAAVIKGIVAFSDAWLGTPSQASVVEPGTRDNLPFVVAEIDEADVKTRLVRSTHSR